jgi:hypothetical protein
MKNYEHLALQSVERKKYMFGCLEKEAHRLGFLLGYEAAIMHVLDLVISDNEKHTMIFNLLMQEVIYAD